MAELRTAILVLPKHMFQGQAPTLQQDVQYEVGISSLLV